MSELFTDELDAYELTVAANVVDERSDSTIIRAIVENGTGVEGGEVDLRVSGLASSAYGLQACITAFERFLNSTLRPEFRLGAVLAIAEHGPFTVVTTPEAGPRVIAPAKSVPEDLAA
jgi:hypothetical protein